MSEAIVRISSVGEALPVPDAPITTRLATMEDLPFIGSLQKQYSKQLGFFPRAQMEGYIRGGWVVIAESAGKAVGYCASRDRYLKRDELGAVFQLCVVPGVQRKLIGATLLKNVFERASYGTKLYCCWCAQDLEANWFWESMGFVPLAFRAGSAKKSRVHIFWERRIRSGDVTTPYWFPSQTNAGAVREDRLVLPIPPGTHWRDVMPIILPGAETPKLEDRSTKRTTNRKDENMKLKTPTAWRGQFGPPSAKPVVEQPATEKPKPAKKPKAKIDPRMVSAARELRDRYLEQVNDAPMALSGGKYDVSRAIEDQSRTKQVALLPAA